ncbi:MarR family winged helix-turn-helix transcriptional regulator [Methanosarcina sp.]|uniref:MarR family winged helix-turn-helix transcriptional regulator n=1 Tax=Methanosarcina sp. TaxID=2213 RepID=UPI002AB85C92|nr:MarR family winged helix-turn-helix transcriptional regulator [Methanosarcina sp.]MDY9928145.1 MarR family winged helix-turn-helix transcriptional regulator [Methanosarcina sp.]
MPDEDAEKLFLQEKPTLALLFIGSMGKTYASVISKEIDSTFAHTTRILSKMEQSGLIRFTFEGRIKFVELTEYGKEVETALEEFRNIIAKESPSREKSLAAREYETVGEGEETADKEPEELEGKAESEKAKELDPFSAEILEKIRNLRNKIESIYREAVEKGQSKEMVSRKLGPYSRDVKKLHNQIEKAETPVDETVISALDETEGLLEFYLKSSKPENT